MRNRILAIILAAELILMGFFMMPYFGNTAKAADAPVVTLSVPPNGGTGISRTPDITLSVTDFDHVAPAPGAFITLKVLGATDPVGRVDATTLGAGVQNTGDPLKRDFTIPFSAFSSSSLLANATYEIYVDGGCFYNGDSTPVPNVTGSSPIATFITKQAPTVTASTTSGALTGVTRTISVTERSFTLAPSLSSKPAAGTITIKDTTNPSNIISYIKTQDTSASAGTSFVYNFEDFSSGTTPLILRANRTYEVTVPAGAFVVDDTDASNYNEATTFAFNTTLVSPVTIPTLAVTSSPSPNATGISTSLSSIRLEFSETIRRTSNTTTIPVTITPASGTGINGTISATSATYSYLTVNLSAFSGLTLQPNTAYTVTIPANSLVGNSFNEPNALISLTFTTGAAASATTPTITLQSPTGSAVPTTTSSLILAFSEAVEAQTGRYVYLKYGTTTKNVLATSGTYNAANKTYTYSMSAFGFSGNPLVAGQTYSVYTDANTFKDTDGDGNYASPSSFTGGSSFTTASSTSALTASLTSPQNASLSVSTTLSTMTITFSKAVNPVSGKNVTLSWSGGSKTISTSSFTTDSGKTQYSIALSGLAIATSPNTLLGNTSFTVSIDAGAFADANDPTQIVAGGSLGTFTTSGSGSTTPTATLTKPSNNASSVAISSSTLEITFSEAVEAQANTKINLRDGSTTKSVLASTGSRSSDGKVFTWQLSSFGFGTTAEPLEKNKTYTVSVDASAFKDMDGNNLYVASGDIGKFTTGTSSISTGLSVRTYKTANVTGVMLSSVITNDTGLSLSYQWQVMDSNGNWSNIAGATTKDYEHQGGSVFSSYRLIVTDTSGKTYTYTAGVNNLERDANVTKNGVRVYESNSTRSKTLFKIKKSDDIRFLGFNGNYAKIEFDGEVGWVSANYISVQFDPSFKIRSTNPFPASLKKSASRKNTFTIGSNEIIRIKAREGSWWTAEYDGETIYIGGAYLRVFSLD